MQSLLLCEARSYIPKHSFYITLRGDVILYLTSDGIKRAVREGDILAYRI